MKNFEPAGLLNEYFASAVKSQRLILKCSDAYMPQYATDEVLRTHTFAVFLSFVQFINLTKKYPLALQKVRTAVVSSCVDDKGYLKRSTGGLIEFMDGVDLLSHFMTPEDIFTQAGEYFLGTNPSELSLWDLKSLFEWTRDQLVNARRDREDSYQGYTERSVINYLRAENIFFPGTRSEEEVSNFMTQSLMQPTIKTKQ